MYILYNVMIYWYVDHFGLTFYVLTQGHPWLLTQGHPWLLGKCFMQNLEIFYLKKNDGRYIDIDGDMLVHVRRIQQGVSWHSVFHFLCSVKTEFSRSVAMSLPTWRDLFILQNSLHSLSSGFGQIRKPRTQGLHHLGHLRLQRRVGHLLSTLSTEDGTNLLKNPGGASNLERP